LKARRVVLLFALLAVVAFIVTPIVFSITASGRMLVMPVILTRDGEALSAKDLRSVRYIFRESSTSFERINIEEMKDAKPIEKGFYVEAPYSTTRSWMFGRPSISPEYRSLTIQLSLVGGETFTMNVPVLSDTRLNSPIQLDISNLNK